jgi:hypothetical protein
MKSPTIHLILLVLGLLFTQSPGYADNSQEYEANLRGKNEVPPVDTRMKGRIEVKFNRDDTLARFQLKVEKVGTGRIIQAHLHCGPKEVNGPVVVFLLTPLPNAASYNDKTEIRFALTDDNVVALAEGHGSTCPETQITNLAELKAAIEAGNIYANVHSVAFPGGEIRGQLRKD